MVKINRTLNGFMGVIVFSVCCFSFWLSLNGYFSFFQLKDVIFFSWHLGLLIFGIPLMLCFSYMAFHLSIKNRPAKINNRLFKAFGFFALLGAIFSFVFSGYVDIIVREKGYQQCPKKSLAAPRKYVKNMSLC